jgi:hypothetical protein
MGSLELAVEWLELLRDVAASGGERAALAALSAWLAKRGPEELAQALASPPPASLSDYHANTVAAMVEHVCAAAQVFPPEWTRDVQPLAEPAFASDLSSLRLHLLVNSPAAFRRRNLFVDTVPGGQV